jgi:cytochrome P450
MKVVVLPMCTMMQAKFTLDTEWKETTFDKDATNIIARLSTCIFMPGLAHNEEWLKIAVDYTVDFFTGAFILRMIPRILRPIAHWVLPPTRKLRKDIKIAQRLINGELAARKRKQEEDRKAGRPVELPVDALQWVETVSHNKGMHCDPVHGQLNYTLGAVHTTSITFINAVCDLIANPEYVELLREEVNTVYAANGNQWNKTSVSQLQLMDSFMKESARLSPTTMCKYKCSGFSQY